MPCAECKWLLCNYEELKPYVCSYDNHYANNIIELSKECPRLNE